MNVLSLAVLVAATTSPVHCDGSAASSIALVRQFYTTALVEKHVREGFERDVSPDLIEHKPDVASGDRAGAIAFLEGLVAALPQAKWEMLRVTGDADLVSVHARFVPAEGAPAYAIADFFRIEQCRIVEHWDVVAGPPNDAVNVQSRF